MDFTTPARLGRPVGRRFMIEWALVGCLGIAVILAASVWRLTASVDRLVYDHFLSLRSAPLSSDIVVVTIDDTSIERLGRWPWPRSTHAQLLAEIAKARPAAIVYDVLFTEPAPGDDALAAAVAANPTYLPVLLSPAAADGKRTVVTPVAPLASAAAGLGHINLEVDGDGIVRSVARFEGDARWPQLMVPVFRALRPSAATMPARALDPESAAGSDGRFLIPFSRLSESYPQVSFEHLLAGDVPEQALRGKVVLIGVTASGLYDRFATPVSGELGPMPGVLIHANVLDTLLTGRAIGQASVGWLATVSLPPLVVLLGGFLLLSPWRSLVLTAVLCAAAFGTSAALLFGLRVWVTPVPAIAGLVAVYPIWNWRRLEMTMSYLRRELQRVADEPYLLPETPRPRSEFRGDVLERHMALMARAAQRVQDMKHFVWDSLDSVPEPLLVSDARGVVLITNHAAKAYFSELDAPAPEGRPMHDVLAGLMFAKTLAAASEASVRLHWPAPLDPTALEYAEAMKAGIEVSDRNGRDHLLRYATCTNAQGQVTGWIAGLVDVSALHAAERQREDALRFLSHDMRSPQASILALVELERPRIDSEPARALLDRIQRYARRALTLADDFVQLERAELQAYALEPASLAELAIDASDEVWPQAQAKRIHIDTQVDDAAVWIGADRSLMTRALVNVLNNAIKYSPSDTRITCVVGKDPVSLARVRCVIRDQGYGIPLEQQVHLFERFRRFHAADRPEVSGAGLGMAFVKIVVMRHGGEVWVDSAPECGTAVTIALPSLDETVA